MHFSKLTAATLLALVASVSSVSASPADGAYAGGFPAGGYGNPAPIANAAAPAASGAPAAAAPAPAATGAPAAGAPAAGAPVPVTTPVASPAPVTPPVGTVPAAPAPVPGAPATGGKVITVLVGNGNLTFIPRNPSANVGDIINFVWNAGNHTVTQSTKADLCTRKADAFASGAHVPPFSFNITVNSTDPLWFFCGIPNHCMKGMYGAVNFPADQMFPTPAGAATGAAGNATGNGTSTDAPKTNAAPSLTSMSTSALLAGALALGAFLL